MLIRGALKDFREDAAEARKKEAEIEAKEEVDEQRERVAQRQRLDLARPPGSNMASPLSQGHFEDDGGRK